VAVQQAGGVVGEELRDPGLSRDGLLASSTCFHAPASAENPASLARAPQPDEDEVVTERTVMAVMSWSSTAMAARYQHVVAAVRRDVAVQVGGLLWRPPGAGEGPPPAA
jgi:hypothetical protein